MPTFSALQGFKTDQECSKFNSPLCESRVGDIDRIPVFQGVKFTTVSIAIAARERDAENSRVAVVVIAPMADALLPPEVLRNLKEVDGKLGKVEEEVATLISNFSRENLEELTSVERAATFLTISQCVNVLFSLYLKTNGLSPEEHPAKSELDRVALYKEKVNKAVVRSKAMKRPSSSLDVQAANRFIEHAIPDLSEDQKRRMQDIGKIIKRQHDKTSNFAETRKPSGMSIADEAALFLAEARKELMKDKNFTD